MNKLFLKIGAIMLGAGLVIGSGAAIAAHRESFKVAKATAGTDVMNQAWTGITNTSYTDKTGLLGSTSAAVYSLNAAGGKSSIQLRSKNNNSGIVSTASGGTIKSVSVTWQSDTTSGANLDIYGKNSAYSVPADLYDDSTSGTKLGTITHETSTSLTVSGSYSYIGLRSRSGAMYLTTINVEWELPSGYTVSYQANGATSGTAPTDSNSPYTSGAKVTVLGNTGNLAKTGYYFDGWNTKADGTGTDYAAGNTFNISGNTTLYAKWTKDTLSSIAIGGSLTKTAYSLSDVWDPSGLVVTATFAHGSGDVTSDVVWSYSTFTTSTSVTSVTMTASYTWNEVTKTDSTTESVSVAALASPYTLIPGTNGFGNSGKTELASWVNDAVTSEVYLDDIIFTATNGNDNHGKYYTSNKSWRFYSSTNGALTISVTGSKVITSVKLTFSASNTGTISEPEGDTALTSNTAWEPATPASSFEFAIGRTDESKTGRIDITKIVIEYESSASPRVEINDKVSSLVYGATGTFSATTYNPSDATVTWSTSDASVLSVNASTGAYEALKHGVATITATITVSATNYTDTMEVAINGETLTINEAKTICAALDSGTSETTAYTVKVSGYIVNLNADSQEAGSERALTLADAKLGGSELMAFGVYNDNPLRSYAVINGTVTFEGKLQNFKGTYEIKNLTLVNYTDDAMTFAKASYEALATACEAGPAGVTDEAWNALAANWEYVDSNSQIKLRGATSSYAYSEDIAHWIDRYDRIVASGKSNFMGRTYESNYINSSEKVNNNSLIIVVVSTIALVSSVGVALLVLRKRKHQ